MNGSHSMAGEVLLGRMDFIRSYCSEKKRPHEETVQRILAEALRLAGSADRQKALHQTLFGKKILPTSTIPDWIDRVWLEATCKVLTGPALKLDSRSSAVSCVALEAGKHNARRQSESFLKGATKEKNPEQWLSTGFSLSYKFCYGAEAASRLRIEKRSPNSLRVSMDHRDLEKACPLDCTTILGYLHASLQRLGLHDLLVTHDACCTDQDRRDERCLFTIKWSEAPPAGDSRMVDRPWQ